MLQREDNDSDLTCVCSTLEFIEHFELSCLHPTSKKCFLGVMQLAAARSLDWGRTVQLVSTQASGTGLWNKRPHHCQLLGSRRCSPNSRGSRPSTPTAIPESIAKLRRIPQGGKGPQETMETCQWDVDRRETEA